MHIFRVLFMYDREVLCAHFQSFVYVRSWGFMCTFSEFCLCPIVRFYVHISRVLFMSDREVLCAHFQSFVYVRS